MTDPDRSAVGSTRDVPSTTAADPGYPELSMARNQGERKLVTIDRTLRPSNGGVFGMLRRARPRHPRLPRGADGTPWISADSVTVRGPPRTSSPVGARRKGTLSARARQPH